MAHTVFKPFWSYDIEKTEKWLSLMASEGYHLAGLNTQTRRFMFEMDHPKETNYHIEYSKVPALFPSLEDDGWAKVLDSGKWLILRNDKPTSEITKLPLHDGLLTRNRRLLYVFSVIFLYMIFAALLPVFLILWTLLSEANGTVEGSPFWILTIAIGICMWTIIPYSTIKLYKSNKKLMESSAIQKNGENHTLTVSPHKVTSKRKAGWQYAPDKLEDWLENMERKGYHLYRISKFGIKFYFVERPARKVTYCVDYQKAQNQGYFDMHKGAGWDLKFTSTSFLSKWSIWSKEYEEIPQQFYSDREQKLKQARRVALAHSSTFGSFAFMYLALIVWNIDLVQRDGMDGISWFVLSVFGFAIIEFAAIVFKSINYYRRVKQNVYLH